MPRKGRGAGCDPQPRYLATTREDFDDGWSRDERAAAAVQTTVTVEHARSIITRNASPDLPFNQSINPYRGCEHGCVYCYARPGHAYVDLSPGLDFESRLFSKPNAAQLLVAELLRPGYRCEPIALGASTDAYQPVERRLRITRAILEVLAACGHPVIIVSKSALIERDLDLLASMARAHLVQVYISVTTLDRELARRMEPRAAAPQRRIETLARLQSAGVATGVMFAPLIPALNDHELEAVLEAAAGVGCRHAGYVMLRLPHELSGIFRTWLADHYPLKAKRVMARVRDVRGGRDNDPAFGSRLVGTGVFAQLIERRFARACNRLGLDRSAVALDASRFKPPSAALQLDLF